ncbi:MAG: M67 family metallopeptidase [Alphaproteobacteria bacterium]|nr:M67 family metallopeptidase [Alphaproteobacteria bacterium]
MIAIDPPVLEAIVAAAEASYPDEACGLLVGRWSAAGHCRLHRAVASANLAPDPSVAFEIDPALRLDLQRRLRGGGQRVVGLYHSHPDGPARPSARDLARAWEPGLLWLILSVPAGEAVLTGAHLVERRAGCQAFREVPLGTGDGAAAPGGCAAGGEA